MKKALVIISIILICLAILFLLLRGVQTLLLWLLLKDMPPQDWSVHLPNDYEIWRINSKDIVLVKDPPAGTSDTIVSNYINAYCYDQRYIGLWCAKDGPDDLLGVAPELDRFYLVDTQEDLLYGPFTPTEYDAICLEKDLSGFNDWTKTYPAPEESTYP